MNKLMSLNILLVFPFLSFAVCLPSNLSYSMFLGFSRDETQYAVAHYDQVLYWGAKDKKDSTSAKICFYQAKDNEELKCEEFKGAAKDEKEFALAAKNYAQSTFKDWEIVKAVQAGKIDSTLDCRGTSEERPRCVIEISEEVGALERKTYLKEFHQVKAHSNPSPTLRLEHLLYVSPRKSNYCFKYRISHESANCNSFEEPIYCAKLKD